MCELGTRRKTRVCNEKITICVFRRLFSKEIQLTYHIICLMNGSISLSDIN